MSDALAISDENLVGREEYFLASASDWFPGGDFLNGTPDCMSDIGTSPIALAREYGRERFPFTLDSASQTPWHAVLMTHGCFACGALSRRKVGIAAKRGYAASEGVPLHYTHREAVLRTL